MKLNEIRDNEWARKKSKRVGRGIASGKGKTSGSGQKGQKARTGVAINGFEGGQMPIYRRLPKRGFNNIFKKVFSEVNLSNIQDAIDAGKIKADQEIDAQSLLNAGVIRKLNDGIALLGRGEIKDKVTIKVAKASVSAKEAIEKRPDNKAMEEGLLAGNIDIVKKNMVNVLEGYTLSHYKQVKETKEKMIEVCPGASVLMSGSGPSVFAVSQDREELERGYKELKEINEETYLTRTIV